MKAPLPAAFNGATDGDSVKNFVDSLEVYFELVDLKSEKQRARFASVLLTGKARTWYAVQDYDFDDLDSPLTWEILREDLLTTFRPADYQRVARKKLMAVC